MNESKGWSNFIRGEASSSEKLKHQLQNGMIVIEDSKFMGEKIVIQKLSDLKRKEVSFDRQLQDLVERHFSIVERLLDLSKQN